jgi:hypothetical protein
MRVLLVSSSDPTRAQTHHGYTLTSMQPWREFLLPNAAFPIRAYNFPGVRIGSLRLVPASRLSRAANALTLVRGGGRA